MRVVSTMLALVVSLWMVGNLSAQDKKAAEAGTHARTLANGGQYTQGN